MADALAGHGPFCCTDPLDPRRVLCASTCPAREVPDECWCSDSAQEYGLIDDGCPRHDRKSGGIGEGSDA